MANGFTLSLQQAQELMHLLTLHGPVQVIEVRQYNHTYRISCQDQTFYLKLHTKDWYPPDEGETGYSVRHEISAWEVLAQHGLAAPEIILTGLNHENTLRHAFLLTREVPGSILADILLQVSPQEILQILSTIGTYLRRMHAIQFPFAGYILGDGPTAPPNEHYWQHPIWTLPARQRSLQTWIQGHSAELTPSLLAQLEQTVQLVREVLMPAYRVSHFTQGDCASDQIIMAQQDGNWRVAALLDMEVASAGDCISDLVSLCASLAQVLPPTLCWWQALFEGYGNEPDFEGFRLRLLGGWYPYEAGIWPGVGENGFGHLLQAKDWQTLFSHTHLPFGKKN